VTKEELQDLVRAQLEWCEAFNQLVPGNNIQAAYVGGKLAVYVTSRDLVRPGVPAHRLVYEISSKHVIEKDFAASLKEESAWWNGLSDAEKVERANVRIGTGWHRGKLEKRLAEKGFTVRKAL